MEHSGSSPIRAARRWGSTCRRRSARAWRRRGRRVVCLAGDGSIMMNVQELQTIAGLGLPIKIFVLNNSGYLSIRLTQRNFFPDNPVGAGPESGVTFPDFERLAYGFGIPFCRCDSHAGLRDAISATLEGEGPRMCEIVLDPEQPFSPRVSSKRLEDGRMVTAPLEDMFPFLSGRSSWATCWCHRCHSHDRGKRCAGASLGHETCSFRDVPSRPPMIERDIFDELFVLEMANNHWGSVERGLKIIDGLRAGRPLQQRPRGDQAPVPRRGHLHPQGFPRPPGHPLHQEDAGHQHVEGRLSRAGRGDPPQQLHPDGDAVRREVGRPVRELGIPIIKIASSDLNDWVLIEKIAKTRKPVIVSTGGTSLQGHRRHGDVLRATATSRSRSTTASRSIPTEDHELELNQIDFLRDRYPERHHRLLDPRVQATGPLRC